ncbi:MAG: gliding motility-associated-like protein [Crocinitomix sp.]|jgi:gliding motility-associated-like protein
MKVATLLLFGLILASFAYSQEICDNALDDDGDGLIDLNDDDCDCDEIIVPDWSSNLVPNHSFEEMSCCPSGVSDTDCLDDWDNIGSGTSDYLNHCDYWTLGVGPDYPLPSPGEGYAGFWPGEAIGCCPISPLLAGETYFFSAQVSLESFWPGDPEMSLSIFGGLDCGPAYFDNFMGACASTPYWKHIATETQILLLDDSWAEITFSITPAEDVYSLSFTPCLSMGYFYIDDIFIGDSTTAGSSNITQTGSYCDGDLELNVTVDSVGGSWQWYLDGIALLGETTSTLDAMLYGLGDYSAVYALEGSCIRSDYTAEDLYAMDANFEFTNICLGVETDFTNTSVYDGPDTPEWEWSFGDGESSTDESPSHTYVTSGTFIVELIGVIESGCNDTIAFEIIVEAVPTTNFEFVIGGVSSADGSTGGCVASTVQFNDLSTIADPGVITNWSWDFGDGGSSDEESPEYIYDTPGTYTVILTVETENGCTSTISHDIIMTENLSLDIIFNEPTCFGFSDGSITINITGGSDDLTFEISNDLGELMNEDNSNTANTLFSGNYNITVTDGTECSVEATIFLDQPEEMDADLVINDVLCYGDATGWVKVDTVYNANGLYDQISYLWAPNPTGINGLGADSIWTLTAGDYTLTLNDENGCSEVIDFTINEPDSMHLSEFGFEYAHCRVFGYQSGNGVVYGASTGGTPDYDYLWTNLDNGETEDNTTWGGLNPGNYELAVTDNNGCVLTKSIFLDSLSPKASFNVISDQLNVDCQGTAAVIVEFENASENFYNLNDPFGDSTFFWNLDNPNTSWELTHDYLFRPDTVYSPKNDSYQVEVCLVAINKNGCSDTACKVITIYAPIEFEAVNIFTPNGDGNNDVFTFEFKSASISEFNCFIVNRWGVVVHELNSITDGWDGTDQNGDPCKDGVYYYQYQALTDNNTRLIGQGNIQLVNGN